MIERTFHALLLAAAALPVAAQEPSAATAEQAVAAAEAAYGPVDTRAEPQCPERQAGDEIVVCGETVDPDKYRVRSSADLDPTAAKDIVPRAPDLYNLYQPAMVGVGVSAKGCFIPPCPSPMPLLIDLKALPEAPPGSDADRVARGLAPLGQEDRRPSVRAAAPEPPLTPPE